MKPIPTLLAYLIVSLGCTRDRGTGMQKQGEPSPSPQADPTATSTPQATEIPTVVGTSNTNDLLSADEIINKYETLFKQAQFQWFRDHSSTYYRLVDMIEAGALKKDSTRTLVHFDYHSDMYRDNSHLDGNINIGNYINTMISKQLVREIWWIVPDSTRSTTPVGDAWGCASIGSQNALYWGRTNKYVDWQFRDGPADQIICVASDNSFTFGALAAGCKPGRRAVKVFKRTLEDVLSGSGGKISGPTILDIDADFFDMSGKYANESPSSPRTNIGPNPACYQLHYSGVQLEEELRQFSIAISEKLELKPDYIAVSESPGYAVKNLGRIFGFLRHLGSKTKGTP